MSQGEDIRRWLLGLPSLTAIVGDRIHQNTVPQGTDNAYVYYARRAVDRDTDATLDDFGTTPYRVNWDVECISEDLDQAQNAAEVIQAQHHHRGDFGTGRVGGVFIQDQSDEYEPKGVQSDSGWQVAALDMQIAGYQE